MTRRKSSEDLKKITLNVNARDYERMQALYPKVGATVAIRHLVHAHVMKVEAKAASIMDPGLIEDLEVDLNLEPEQ